MRTAFKQMIVAAVMTAAGGGPLAARAAAQPKFQNIGPKQCTNCHDHDDEKLWYEKKEIPEVHRLFPDQNNAGHINSLKQLEAKKSDDYAKAVGLADKYDAAGSCVACHGTVFGGEANAGVSCESCHGPGSGYKDPHQPKDSYERSVKEFGMTKLIGNFAGWTQQCTNCHVMTEDKLIAAGHPSGDDFDLSKKFVPVSLHFKKKYDVEEIAGIAKTEMQAVLRRRGRPVPTPAPAATAPAADAAASPAPATAPGASAGAPPPAASAAPPPAAAAPPAQATPDTAAAAPARGAAASTPPRPRPAARPAPIDPGAPPAGSPTSTEPPPPPDAAPATAAAAAAAPDAAGAAPSPASAPKPPETTAPAVAIASGGMSPYVWVAAAVVLLAIVVGVVAVARKRK
jgi:hypothetical protein